MRRALPLMAWAAVWTIVVMLAAVIVWSAISRAGSHVTNQATLTVPGVTVTRTPSSPTPRSTSQATPRPTPRPSSQPSSRPTSRRTPDDSKSDRPGPVAVQGWWSGSAGRITATCRAHQIRLDAAVPADGFTVEIGGRGPEDLEVEFHQAQGEHETKVRGVCGSDGPRFAVEQE